MLSSEFCPEVAPLLDWCLPHLLGFVFLFEKKSAAFPWVEEGKEG